MTFGTGYLVDHPVPAGIVGALSLSGYQLLADVAGVGAGRLGPQAFLIIAADPDPARPDDMPHISLHEARLRDETQAAAYVQLAGALGYLRLSGYRLALERVGLRSELHVIDPANGRIVVDVPDKHPGGLLRGSRSGQTSVTGLLARVGALPPAGPPPRLDDPERLRDALVAIALRDQSIGGAEAAERADRALTLMRSDPALDPAGALDAAR